MLPLLKFVFAFFRARYLAVYRWLGIHTGYFEWCRRRYLIKAFSGKYGIVTTLQFGYPTKQLKKGWYTPCTKAFLRSKLDNIIATKRKELSCGQEEEAESTRIEPTTRC